jgi:ketosteroid isomerase-like protein
MSRAIAILIIGLSFGAVAPVAADIHTCDADTRGRVIAEDYDARWRAALAVPSAADLAQLYGESAVLMPPTDETYVGRMPIVDYLTRSHVPGQAARYSVDLVSCELRGDALHIAAVWGIPGANGGWQSGNVLRVLEPNDDGTWVASYEIWN